MSGSLMISWGRSGGLYFTATRSCVRLCLWRVAFTWLRYDVDDVVRAGLDAIDLKKIADDLARCPVYGEARGTADCEVCGGDLLLCPVYGSGERRRREEDASRAREPEATQATGEKAS